MSSSNRYDVTNWHAGDPYQDVGAVINSIVADVKERQAGTKTAAGPVPSSICPRGTTALPPRC